MDEFEKDVLNTYVRDCLPALDLLREAVKRPHYWSHYLPMDDTPSEERSTSVNHSSDRPSPFPTIELSSHLMEGVMPRLGKHRQLAQAMQYQIESDIERNFGEKALFDGLVLTRFGRHLCGRGLVVEELVGMAVVGLGVGEINRVLSKVDMDREVLASAYQDFEALLKMDRPWFTYDCEKALFYDLIQQGFTDDGQGDGRPLVQGVLIAARTPSDWWKGLLFFDYPGRRETTQRVDTLYETVD